MKKSILILFLTGLQFCLLGQSRKDSIATLLSTPYKALQTFTDNAQAEQPNFAGAALLFNDPDASEEELMEVASKYQHLLEGAGLYIFFEDVPTNPDYFDSIANEHRYVVFDRMPEIYLQKRKGKWQFQPKAMKAIEAKYNDLFVFGSNILFSQEQKEDTFGVVLFGLKLWQWIAISILLLLSIGIRLLFSFLFGRLLIRFLASIGKADIGSRYLLPVSRPVGFLAVLFLISVFYPTLQLPPLVSYYVVLVLKGLVPLFGMIVLYRLANVIEIFFGNFFISSDEGLNHQLLPLIKKTLKVMIVLIGGLVIMDSLDIPILPLLTGLSIGGLAFALAAQDTIKNFFGSVMIFIDKPFKIGDWITSSDIDGTVEEVGFRSTRVRTFRNSVIYVPNGKLADTVIDNNGLREFRRFRTIIAIKYDTPPDRIEVFVEGLKQIVLRHPKTNKEKYEIHLNDMGASSLDVLFYIFFHAPTWTDELKFRQEIILDILRLGEKLSVHFAFPTQTVHVENLPGQNSLSPVYTLTREDLNRKLNEFLDETASAKNK